MEGFAWSYCQSTVHLGGADERAGAWEPGHIASTVRRQSEKCLYPAYFLLLIQSRTLAMKWYHYQLMRVMASN